MMPYEELLWSYPAGDLAVPFDKKLVSVAYRGSCTNPHRVDMVDAVREAFPSHSDVAVSCRENFEPLSPADQGRHRCLLDYDGNGYSRRMAWYLQTGSVVLRGGVIDDVLSRLARDNDDDRSVAPVAFWKWGRGDDYKNGGTAKSTLKVDVEPMTAQDASAGGLLASVRSCLTNDVHAKDVSASALKFWSNYVENGQSVWDGFMAHLLVHQSSRLKLTLDEADYLEVNQQLSSGAMGWTHRSPLFQSLSESNMVCSVVFDSVTPTGHNGQPRWKYIICCLSYCVAVFSFFYMIILPTSWELMKRTIKRKCGACADATSPNTLSCLGLGSLVRDE